MPSFDDQRARHGVFGQFVAVLETRVLQADHEVIEARWFEDLPPDVAVRDDDLEDFRKIRPGTTF